MLWLQRKMPQYNCLSKRNSFEASLSKSDCPVWQTGVFGSDKKIHNFRAVQQRLQGGT
jgi:hypothetical protein